MKTEGEIKNKIDTLMELATRTTNTIKEEGIHLQIDALLWVIGNRNGYPTIDERYDDYINADV